LTVSLFVCVGSTHRQLVRDCPYNDEFKRGKKLGCGVRFPDLDPPTRPPDVSPTMRSLKLVKG
jgi:hypothetical protein